MVEIDLWHIVSTGFKYLKNDVLSISFSIQSHCHQHPTISSRHGWKTNNMAILRKLSRLGFKERWLRKLLKHIVSSSSHFPGCQLSLDRFPDRWSAVLITCYQLLWWIWSTLWGWMSGISFLVRWDNSIRFRSLTFEKAVIKCCHCLCRGFWEGEKKLTIVVLTGLSFHTSFVAW